MRWQLNAIYRSARMPFFSMHKTKAPFLHPTTALMIAMILISSASHSQVQTTGAAPAQSLEPLAHG